MCGILTKAIAVRRARHLVRTGHSTKATAVLSEAFGEKASDVLADIANGWRIGTSANSIHSAPKREVAILETIARRVERSGATPEAHRKARKAALHALMRGASGHRALAAAQDALDPPGVEIHPTPSAAKFAREAKADPTRWNIRPVGRGLAHELRFIGEPEVSHD